MSFWEKSGEEICDEIKNREGERKLSRAKSGGGPLIYSSRLRLRVVPIRIFIKIPYAIMTILCTHRRPRAGRETTLIRLIERWNTRYYRYIYIMGDI